MLGLVQLQQLIKRKLEKHEQGLYIVMTFPVALSTLLTFTGARIVSFYWPHIYLEPSPGLHIHHFAYGFIILAAAGYLGLIFSGPRARFLIALLFGLGLGLAFDEMAMWIKLRDDEPVRWEYDGIVFVLSSIIALFTLVPGVKFVAHHWPFSKANLKQEHQARKPRNWD